MAAVTLLNMLWMISRAPAPGGLGLPLVRPDLFPLQAALAALKTTLTELIA